jgi:predicted ester cyclase
MSVAGNKALFVQFYVDIWNTGDVAALDEVLAPDFRNHGLGETAIPHRELYKQAILETRAGFPDWTNALDEVIAEGDIVAARWRATGTHIGSYGPWPPTGRKVVILGMTFVRIAQGRITDFWKQDNSLTVPDQLGVAPPNT